MSKKKAQRTKEERVEEIRPASSGIGAQKYSTRQRKPLVVPCTVPFTPRVLQYESKPEPAAPMTPSNPKKIDPAEIRPATPHPPESSPPD